MNLAWMAAETEQNPEYRLTTLPLMGHQSCPREQQRGLNNLFLPFQASNHHLIKPDSPNLDLPQGLWDKAGQEARRQVGPVLV